MYYSFLQGQSCGCTRFFMYVDNLRITGCFQIGSRPPQGPDHSFKRQTTYYDYNDHTYEYPYFNNLTVKRTLEDPSINAGRAIYMHCRMCFKCTKDEAIKYPITAAKRCNGTKRINRKRTCMRRAMCFRKNLIHQSV